MSTPDGKIKVYKNPDRTKAGAYKPYVPQYQVHGKEPGEYKGAIVPNNTAIATPAPLPLDNPRSKRPAINQPYASPAPSPIGYGPVPNIGNNMEHTWSGVDSQLVDDISNVEIDPNHPMIDNNDYVTPASFGFQNGVTAADLQPSFEQKTFMTEDDLQRFRKVDQSADDLFYILSDLAEDSYLLIVSGVSVCSGPLEEIQDQARALVFGEHEMCDGNPIPSDDIVILKRVKIKVGLFLE